MRRERSLLVKAAPRGLCLLLYQIKAAWAQRYNHGDSEKVLLTGGSLIEAPASCIKGRTDTEKTNCFSLCHVRYLLQGTTGLLPQIFLLGNLWFNSWQV